MKKWWVGWLACLVAGQVQAAGFDCGKADTKVEKLICAGTELSKLDEKLAKAYKYSARRTAEPARYKHEQRAWLKGRDECLHEGDATTCLKERYTRRIQALSGDCWRHGKWIVGKGDNPYVSGKNWPMCRIMLENLNRFCHEPPEAMECGLKLDPGIASLKTPDWQAIDPKQNMEWVSQKTGREIRNRADFVRYMENQALQLSETRFDLTNDGVPEHVIKIDMSAKDPATDMIHYMCAHAVVDECTNQVDRRIGFDALRSFEGNAVRNAGRTYFFRKADGEEWELAEPWGGYRGGPSAPRAPGETPVYGDTRVCLFERVTN